MVGIAQNDLRAQLFQDVLRDSLYRSRSAARHKRRSFDRAVRALDAAKARWTGLSLDGEKLGHIDMVHSLKFGAERRVTFTIESYSSTTLHFLYSSLTALLPAVTRTA